MNNVSGACRKQEQKRSKKGNLDTPKKTPKNKQNTTKDGDEEGKKSL